MKTRQEIERISRQKRKIRLMFILLGAMAVILAAAIVLVNCVPEDEQTGTTQTTTPLPEILDGEALEGNYALAYPSINQKYIQSVQVINKSSYANDFNAGEAPYTSYTLFRNELAGGNFVLAYENKDGKENFYLPDIFSADPSFEYDSLYAIETGDGYGQIHKLTYLLLALELPYFTDRIALEPEGTLRDSQLRGFGLDEPQATVKFIYTDKDNNEYQKAVKIGEKNVTGVGYYFMVGDVVNDQIVYRPYIYNSLAEYYKYAIYGFQSYVNSILVSAGLAEDSSYEPYLTTDYKQWINELTETAGAAVPAGSTVVIESDIFTPLESKLDKTEYEKDTGRYSYDENVSEENKDGYIKDGYQQISVDLSKKGSYNKLISLLTGKTIGQFAEDLVVTVTTPKTLVDFGEDNTVKYSYEIIEIEAIITDGVDVTAAGSEIGANDKIKVAYYLYIDGTKVSNIPYHGVIDLKSDKFDAAALALLADKTIGKLAIDAYVTLEVDYTPENAETINRNFVIDEIVAIYDKTGKSIEKVTAESQVLFRFYYYVNGEKQGYETSYMSFASDDSESAKEIFAKIEGRTVSKNLSISVYTQTYHCEFVEDFMTYKVRGVNYFVTSELVSAFRFQNNSERDPFYGESIYENMMDNEYSLYAINSSTCEAVAKMLGGIGDTTGSSFGFVGMETVAVGITPKVMRDYHLYEHTVYFELPRGIIVKDSGDENTVDDYDQYNKLGFTLYISNEEYDPDTNSYIRYVGSDLYDIVAKVDADNLVFLKYNFIDFWARRSLMMFDIKYLDRMDVEFMMEDLKGSYQFILPESTKSSTTFSVTVAKTCKHAGGECDCTETKFSQHLKNEGVKATTLTALYNKYMEKDGDEYYTNHGDLLYGEGSYDSAGVGNFRELMGVLYSIPYSDTLTAEEQAQALTAGPIMRITVTLDKDLAPNTTENRHVYEFYRCGDRQVMVRMYEVYSKSFTDSEGNEYVAGQPATEAVSDFCISTLAFKKIVSNYFTILNAQTIYPDQAYPGLSN